MLKRSSSDFSGDSKNNCLLSVAIAVIVSSVSFSKSLATVDTWESLSNSLTGVTSLALLILVAVEFLIQIKLKDFPSISNLSDNLLNTGLIAVSYHIFAQ